MHVFRFEFEAIGTSWVIDVNAPVKVSQEKLFEKVRRRIDKFDKTYSRFRKDSLITKMANLSGTYTFPDDAVVLMRLYETLYKATNGTFTPFIGQTLSDAGYDSEYSLQTKTLHHPPQWEESISYHHPNVTIKKPVLLDFGAAGKGYIIDLVGKVLEQEGITSFCIDAGGDILCKSNERALRVGLEHPENKNQVIGVAEIRNQAICGSAGNRRKWGTFHHIINPHTLSSPQDILSVWVIAKEAIVADGLATALFFVPPEKLAPLYDYEYLILYPDYSIKKSSGFSAEIFYKI